MSANENSPYWSMVMFPSEKNQTGEYFAKDAKITIPENGIPLRFGQEVVQHLKPGDVEVAYTEEGIMLHISLTVISYERLRHALEPREGNW